jgi:hypothetical protein
MDVVGEPAHPALQMNAALASHAALATRAFLRKTMRDPFDFATRAETEGSRLYATRSNNGSGFRRESFRWSYEAVTTVERGCCSRLFGSVSQ